MSFFLIAAVAALFMLAGCATPKQLMEAAPQPVTAQPRTPPCDFRDRVLKHLAEKYQEVSVAVGISDGGGLVEVLATSDGETWTIIVTGPDDWACLVASGTGWRPVKPKPESTAL